jgi:hypothetical protein
MDTQQPSKLGVGRPLAERRIAGFGSLLQGPPTRREVFLFGALLLALFWMLTEVRERTVIVVPGPQSAAGVIT